VKEETLEAMLKHSRKKLNQRTGKLLAKHGNETMGNSTVLTQDIPLSSGEPVRADAVLQDSALEAQITLAANEYSSNPTRKNWYALADLISKRSKQQIRRMEMERGIG
jgi:hypothetical protein